MQRLSNQYDQTLDRVIREVYISKAQERSYEHSVETVTIVRSCCSASTGIDSFCLAYHRSFGYCYIAAFTFRQLDES